MTITKTSITYSQSRKVNLGNYEAQDIFLSMTLESCVPGQEEELYAQAGDFVEKHLDSEEEGLRGKSLNSTAKKKAPAKKKEEPAPEEAAAEEKPKAKKTTKKKKAEPEAEETADEAGPSREAVNAALKAYAKEYDKEDAKAIMQNVAGVSKMADIPEDKFSAILVACEEPPAAEDDFE